MFLRNIKIFILRNNLKNKSLVQERGLFGVLRKHCSEACGRKLWLVINLLIVYTKYIVLIKVTDMSVAVRITFVLAAEIHIIIIICIKMQIHTECLWIVNIELGQIHPCVMKHKKPLLSNYYLISGKNSINDLAFVHFWIQSALMHRSPCVLS